MDSCLTILPTMVLPVSSLSSAGPPELLARKKDSTFRRYSNRIPRVCVLWLRARAPQEGVAAFGPEAGMDSRRVQTLVLIAALSGAHAAAVAASAVFANGHPRGAAPQSNIDEFVFRRLAELGIPPADACTDEVFVRRVYLDAIGTLPTPKDVRQFLNAKNPDKRSVLIDRLLDREEFADYWAMKWGDVLRVKAEFPINLWPNAVQAYTRWIRTSIKQNMPYDQFARELLTASGSNFRAPQVNFYRALQTKEPQAIAKTVALTFMGERADKWKPDRLAGMANFFAYVSYKSTREWKEDIVFFDCVKAAKDAEAGEEQSADGWKQTAGQAGANPIPLPTAARLLPTVFRLPDGIVRQLSPDRDPREVFADWLLAPGNPWFARCIANRVWSWFLGRGIIHEPDDIRPDNPPRNPELLAHLERELVAGKYDLKRLFRLILNSKTYQLSSIPRSKHPDAEANFACYPVRRLDAEVLIDALCQITGTTEEYSSPIPEPFTFLPEDHRSIALPDGSISSSFLEMFGRPPRDTGLESERTNDSTPAQRLHFLNSSHVRLKIEQSRILQPLIASGAKSPRSAATELYLLILSRFPTDQELAIVEAYSRKSQETRGTNALVDLAWALFNSTEFLCRH